MSFLVKNKGKIMEKIWPSIQELIDQLCAEFDKVWQKRQRVIDTKFLVTFITKLVLSRNKQGYGSVLTELWENEEFSKLQATPFSASSICEARQKMPATIFNVLNQRMLSKFETIFDLPLWHGHRIFGVDGSKINLPRELINYGYKAPNNYQYYPKGLISTLYHLGSGLIYDSLLSSDKNERICLISHMDKLKQSDVLVLDRGYFSYLVLTKAIEKKVHLICRMQHLGNMNKEVQKFILSNELDKIINYQATPAAMCESKKQGFDIKLKPIKLRLIKYNIDNNIYICATTLLDPIKYPLDDFAAAYHGRWGIEELYKISKLFIEIEDFHAKSERGIKQECYAHMLIINIARIFALHAENELPELKLTIPKKADQRNASWKNFIKEVKIFQINFKHCLLTIGRNLIKLLWPDELIRQNPIYNILVRSIVRLRQKIRTGRHFVRQSRAPINKWKDCRGGKVPYAA